MIGIGAKTRGFAEIFRAEARRARNPDPVLRATATEIRADSKQTFQNATSRTGEKWAPLKDSTQERLRQTTVGPVSVKGEVRKQYLERARFALARSAKAGKASWTALDELNRLAAGGSTGLSIETPLDRVVRKGGKIERGRKSGAVARLRKELNKTAAERKQGKRAVDRHRPLGNIINMVRARLVKGQHRAEIGMLNDSPLKIHNTGGTAGRGAKIAARRFIELIVQDGRRLAKRLERWITTGEL